MKKLLVVIAIILSLGVVNGFAATNEAINPEAEPMTVYKSSPINSTVIEDASNRKKLVKSSTLIQSGPCRLQSINIYSDTAGDLVGVWDYAGSGSSTNRLEFEIAIAANSSSVSYDAKGAYFELGIFVSPSDGTNSVITVVYDY